MNKRVCQITLHNGVYYFVSRKEAEDWARGYDWPTDRIIDYRRGYAIQAGPSGNYAGPNEIPRYWKSLK